MKLVPCLKPWIDLNIVIQSKVSQKTEKKKYLSLMCGLQKNGKHELICKAEIESQTQRTNLWLPRREMGEDDLEDCD